MPYAIDDVLRDSLGHFWLQTDRNTVDLDQRPITGNLRMQDPSSVNLAGLIEYPSLEQAPKEGEAPRPEFIVGVTDHGGVLLDDVTPAGSSFSIGGSKASTVHYSAQIAVSNVPVDALRSGSVKSTSAHWSGVARWAGIRTIREDATRDDDGRLKALTLELAQVDPVQTRLNEEATVEIGSTWAVSGPSDQRTASAPLRITVTSSRYSSLASDIGVLSRVQDLLNLAFQGAVPASGGTASLEVTDPASSGRKSWELWSRRLMELPAGAKPPKSMSIDPLFFLSDIGGIDGVRKWVELQKEHPKLVRPILSPYRLGHSYSESTLIEVGTAIDYWRGVNARTETWAAEGLQPLAVANSLGKDFATWVIDPGVWARRFWYHYNGLKHHIPSYIYDEEAVYRLALSGLTMLTCVALRRISGDDLIVARLLNGHHWDARGRGLRLWMYMDDADLAEASD